MKESEEKGMKKVLVLFLTSLIVSILFACGHEHVWTDATCTTPKTCSECGETEGEALGHTWVEATCTKPKTCSVCGITEGKALGHKPKEEANCTEPSVCSVCGETVKAALGHNWIDATCTEPKYCVRCGMKEGEALGHAWKEATVRKPKTCERCNLTEGDPLILFYWNKPVDLGVGYTACFYKDDNGHYRFEISNPNQSSATIYMMLENNMFKDYGIGSSMFYWMKHVMEDHRDFQQKGKMVYYSLNGLGNINVFYFNYGDIDSEKNGFVGLEWNYEFSSLYDGTIGE